SSTTGRTNWYRRWKRRGSSATSPRRTSSVPRPGRRTITIKTCGRLPTDFAGRKNERVRPPFLPDARHHGPQESRTYAPVRPAFLPDVGQHVGRKAGRAAENIMSETYTHDAGRFPYFERHLPHQHPEGFPLFFTWNLKGSVPAHLITALDEERRRLN